MADSSTTLKYLFLSDAHIGGFSRTENNKIEQELIHLVDFCEEQKYQLCILGDLFDYWMEYPNYVPQIGKEILNRLKTYNSQHPNSLFITGNHDNWTFGHFQSIGFDVEKNKRTLHLNGKQALVMHGDGLDDPKLNLKRPFLHRLLRHPVFVEIYQRLLSPKTGIEVMKKFSQLARSRQTTPEVQSRLNKWSKQQLQTSNNDVIICGHDHFPRIKEYDFGTFINLGTFYSDRTVVIYTKNKFQLVSWNDEERELKPFQTSQKPDEQFNK